MSALGKLVVSLSLEHAQFTKGLDKSSQEALRFAKNSQDSFNKFEQSAKASFNSAVRSTAGLVAGLLGVTSAIGALNQSINQLAVLDDLSQKTGSTVEELSRLQKVAQQFGQDFGAVEGSLTKLARGIGDLDDEGGKANKALNALGISSKDLSGNLRDPAELMVEVAKRLQNYQDGASKAAIATDLFGKAGVDLLPFLNDLAENVDKFATVSTEAAARAAAFQDNLGLLKVRASEAGISIASGVIPALNEIITKFIEGSEKGGLFQGVLDGILEAGKKLVVGSDENERAAKIANVNKRILSDERKLRELIKQGRSEEAATLKADIEVQKQGMRELIILQSKAYGKNPASPYTNPSDKPALIYNSGDGKAAAEKAMREADKARQEALRAIQDEVAEEFEAADTISAYKQNKLEELAKAKKELDKQEYEHQLKQLDLLQKQANANYDEAQRESQKLAEQSQRQFDRVAGEISQAFTNGLFDSFRKGEDFGKSMVRNIVAFAQTWFARMFESLITGGGFQKLLGSFGSAFSGSAVAGEGGGLMSSLSSGFGSIMDVFKTGNASIVGSIESLGTFLSTGSGGLGDTLGGFLGQYASEISNVLPFAGAAFNLLQGNIAGAIGSGLGAALSFTPLGPLGGIVGSLLGGALGGLFGGGLPPRVTESRTATSSGGVTSFFNGADPGKRKLGAASALDGLNEAFINNLNTLFGAFGVSDDITANSLLTKKKNTRSRFNATVNGEFLGYEEINLGKKGSFQEAFNAMMEAALGGYTVKAIQASSLPEGIKQFFEGLVKKEDVAETISTLISMKNALLDLPAVFDAVRNAMDTTAYKTTIDQLKAQFQATQTFVDLFYSSTEKFDIFTNQLITQFDALNQTIPTSRDQYRALVESINVVDEATRDQFNGLIALAPAMNQYFEYLEQTADGINQVNEALAQALDKNLFSTYADYVTAQANASAGMSYTGSIGDLSVRRSQGDAELANAVKSLVAQQARTDLILAEIADATRRTREINERWNGDGLPETRVI